MAKKTTSKTSSKKQKSIVLLGSRGFKGHNILKRLESDPKYKKVIVIDIVKPDLPLKKCKFYKLDLTETLADVKLAEILKTENCDTLIHTAFPVAPPHNSSYAHELVAIGAFYIFNACGAANVRKILMITTTDVYGASPLNPNYLTEEMTPRGDRQSRFLADKLDAERQAIKFQKKHPKSIVTILRPCTILGPTINSYKTRYLRRPIVTTMLGFDPLIQFVHEQDAIDTIQLMVDHDHAGIFNLTADGVLPLSRVIDICGKINVRLPQFGFKSMVQAMWTFDLSPAPASHVDFLRYLCIADNTKIKKVAGYKPKYTTKETLLSFVGAERLRQVNVLEYQK